MLKLLRYLKHRYYKYKLRSFYKLIKKHYKFIRNKPILLFHEDPEPSYYRRHRLNPTSIIALSLNTMLSPQHGLWKNYTCPKSSLLDSMKIVLLHEFRHHIQWEYKLFDMPKQLERLKQISNAAEYRSIPIERDANSWALRAFKQITNRKDYKP